MLHEWPKVRAVLPYEYLGALTWYNPVVQRANWVYGQAHVPRYGSRQAWSWYSPATVWQGETKYRPEHPWLVFSAYVNIAGGSAAYLEYMNAAGQWQAIAADGEPGAHWFTGTENARFYIANVYNNLPDDKILRLRFYIGLGCECIILARAWLEGEENLTTWPSSLPEFVDGEVPTAEKLNTILQMTQYHYERCQRPAIGSVVGTWNYVLNPFQPAFRWAFTYDGRTCLHYEIETWDMGEDGVSLFLDEEKFPAPGTSRIQQLAYWTTPGWHIGDIDLKSYLDAHGLVKGNRYQIELHVGTAGTFVAVRTIYVRDAANVTRTYLPTPLQHGTRLRAAHLNAIVGSLDQCYPSADRESPIWESHLLQPYQLLRPAPPGDPDIGYTAYMRGVHHYRVRLIHRWRYLRYRTRGSLDLLSADGTMRYPLPDTKGKAAVLDLDSIGWLDYGMEYEVADKDLSWIICAYEDYDI